MKSVIRNAVTDADIACKAAEARLRDLRRAEKLLEYAEHAKLTVALSLPTIGGHTTPMEPAPETDSLLASVREELRRQARALMRQHGVTVEEP